MGAVTAEERSEDSIEMARLTFGADFVDRNCVILGDVNVNSPLVWDGTMTRSLRAYARANQAADFERMRYSGDVTMRGQDIQHQEANAQLALASQDRQMKLLSLMMQMAGGQNASLIY